jgi:hypothetical protein
MWLKWCAFMVTARERERERDGAREAEREKDRVSD